MRRAKAAYMNAVSQGSTQLTPAVPGHIEAPPEAKKELYGKYKSQHAGKAGTVEQPQPAPFERVPSGVPGVDELVGGGFKRNSSLLITGGPGCGKTTFVMQYLYSAAMRGEPGLFISFEERDTDIFDDYAGFVWDLEKLSREKKIQFLYYHPHQIEELMGQGGGMIKDLIKENKIKHVGIDSLTSFALLFKSEYEKRENVLKFFDMLASWNCTILLTSEKTATLETNIGEFGLEFLVDGAILLYNVRKGNIREQALEVLKMRGVNIVKKICPLTISSHGITVFPEAEVFSEI